MKKRLTEILEKIVEIKLETKNLEKDKLVSYFCFDSRLVKNETLFLAVKGEVFDANKKIEECIIAGVTAIFTSNKIFFDEYSIKYSQVSFVFYEEKDAYFLQSRLAEIFFDFPASRLKFIGVTGTNGKTTTTTIINHILRFAGKKTTLIGTVNFDVNGNIGEATHTTPDPISLQQIFASSIDENVEFVIMEVSSHAAAQFRLGSLKFSALSFTNLTGDHLDYHKTMEDYYLAKKSIFTNNIDENSWAIINIEDEFGQRLFNEIELCKKEKFGILYDLKNYQLSSKSSKLFFKDDGFIEIPLVGEFNISNFLLAMKIVEKCGISFDEIFLAMHEFQGVLGRMQQVKLTNEVTAFVDYAHTDDALYNVGKALQKIPHNRIITVFGCGGNRDKTKRPRMAKAAEKFSDIIIVTSDNSRNEKTADIFANIATGFTKLDEKIIFEENRTLAIQKAVALAQKNDLILIAGKGHENYQIIGDKKNFFSDVEVLKTIQVANLFPAFSRFFGTP